jgi:lipoprotein-releasing system ATP-binding protein
MNRSNIPPILELKNICKDYIQANSVIEVLKDFSLKLYPGEIVAIIGASGCGKSTLLHIAGLLDRPDRGDVIINGEAVKKDESLRTKIRLEEIGFVYQYHHLLKDFNARENVAMPRLIANKDYLEALDDADTLLESLDLGNRTFNFPGELSGGQQQRVAIARSLINNPRIVLADEPTGNLDSNSAEIVIKLLRNIVKQSDIGAIIVTHNEHIAQMADRVIQLGA